MRAVLEQRVGLFIEESAADRDVQIGWELADARQPDQLAAAQAAGRIHGRLAELQRGEQHGLQTQIADGGAVHRVEHLQSGEHDARRPLDRRPALQQLRFIRPRAPTCTNLPWNTFPMS